MNGLLNELSDRKGESLVENSSREGIVSPPSDDFIMKTSPRFRTDDKMMIINDNLPEENEDMDDDDDDDEMIYVIEEAPKPLVK